MLKTYQINEFLNEAECDLISEKIHSCGNLYEDYINNILNSYYYTWDFYNKNFFEIKEIFENKIKNFFGLNLLIDHSHILHSIIPYGIHTDYFQRKKLVKNIEPAYTFIIPLANIETHTIVFNEYSKIKNPYEWKKTNNVKPYEDCQIPSEIRNKLLSHINDDIINYFSIKEIFAWKKGSLLASDRQYFHCSDNYIANNLTYKNAIILWTSIKK